jgi:hypothetical protein
MRRCVKNRDWSIQGNQLAHCQPVTHVDNDGYKLHKRIRGPKFLLHLEDGIFPASDQHERLRSHHGQLATQFGPDGPARPRHHYAATGDTLAHRRHVGVNWLPLQQILDSEFTQRETVRPVQQLLVRRRYRARDQACPAGKTNHAANFFTCTRRERHDDVTNILCSRDFPQAVDRTEDREVADNQSVLVGVVIKKCNGTHTESVVGTQFPRYLLTGLTRTDDERRGKLPTVQAPGLSSRPTSLDET